MFDDFDEQNDIFSGADSEFNQQDESSADFFNNEQNPEQDIVQSPQTKLGYKSVGIIVTIVLVILAFIVLSFSKMKVVEKNDNLQSQSQLNSHIQSTQSQINNQTQSTQAQSQEATNSQQVSTDNNNYTSLINIPTNTRMDYSGKVTQAQGVVSSLNKYLQDGQVIYCVNLDIVMGASKTVVHYYCGYNVFSQLSIGDIVNVDYQQVSDTCFSVCTISK